MQDNNVISIGGLTSHASPPAPEARSTKVVTLSAAQKAALKKFGAYSVYVIGYAKPMPAFLGDANGIRPFLIGGSASFEPTYLAQLNRLSPIFPVVLFSRRWFRSKFDAKICEFEMPKLLAKYSTQERCDWLSLNQGADMLMLELEIDELAQKLGVEAFEDDALIKLLDAEVARSSND